MAGCNSENCLCPHKECPNNGKCCACVGAHRGGGSLPYCLQQMLEKQKEAAK